MDEYDVKVALVVMVGLLLLGVTLVTGVTAAHEIIKDGDAKRCAEYNYGCDNN